ncbi:MAG: carboxypeptidase-like regulatory domain-containing protein [Planctomycetota bacterium]
MRSLLVLLVVSVLAAGLAWLACLAWAPGDPGRSVAPAAGASPASTEPPDAGRNEIGPGADPLAGDALDRAAAVPRTGFRVRVVVPDGVGTPVRLRAWRQDRRALTEAAVAAFDSDGRALLAVPEGSYRFSFDGGGVVREALRQRYAVRDGELRELALRGCAPGTITGRVLDADGRPLPDVVVEVPEWDAGRADGGDPWWRTQSDLSGRFAIGGLAPGHQSLSFRHPRHAARDGQGELLTAGLRTDIGDVRMSRGQTLRGRVLDGDRNALPDATVALLGTRRSVEVDAAGRFELDRMPTHGELRIVCEGFQDAEIQIGPADGYDSGRRSWPDLSIPLDVMLSPSMCVRGTVSGGHGAAKVVVRNYALGTCWHTEPEVGVDGTFVADRLHAGRTEIQARVPGVGYSDLVRLDVDGRDHQVELAVRPTRSLIVAVRDDAGARIADAAVTIDGYSENLVFPCIFDSFSNKETRSTDARGDATFGGVFDGRWNVQVVAKGHLPKKVELHLGHQLERTEVRLQRAGRLLVAVRGLPLERESEFSVFHRRGDGRPVELRLRDAAFGVDLEPGSYEVFLGPRSYRMTMLGDRVRSAPTRTVQLAAGAALTCELDYRPAPLVHGSLTIPAWVEGPVVVYALSPDDWQERRRHAHFLDFNLELYGRRAECARDGTFSFGLAEPGTWFFAATLPTTSIPVPLGARQLEGEAHVPFDLPRGVLRGHLDPGFRRADGSWPKVLLEPAFLARHNPFFRLADVGTATHLQMFGRRPAADGSFVIGPLAPGTWTMTIRERRRPVFVRGFDVAAAPIELGLVARPAAGPLTVAVENPVSGRQAVLRAAGSSAGSGAFLVRASDTDGALRFGDLPFGDYELDLREHLGLDGVPVTEVLFGRETAPLGVAIRHRPAGVEPASVRYPGR